MTLRGIVIGVIALWSSSSAWAAGYGEPIFNFNFTSGQYIGFRDPPTGGFFPRLDGVLLGQHGFITGFDGFLEYQRSDGSLYRSQVGSFTGLALNLNGVGYGGRYIGDAGNYSLIGGDNALIFRVGAAGIPNFPDYFWFESRQSLGLFATGGNRISGWTQAVYGNCCLTEANQTYSIVSTPEIDGSVFPRALLIVGGLMFLLIRTRGNGVSVGTQRPLAATYHPS